MTIRQWSIYIAVMFRWFDRCSTKLLIVAFASALVVAACGGAADIDGDSVTDAAEDAAEPVAPGSIGDADFTIVVTTLADGFGGLSQSQTAAIAGVGNAQVACTGSAQPRARVGVSQIEVEVVSVIDDCLEFSYTVANFRSFVADLREIRSEPDVIAASPLLLDYRLNQIESDWPVQAIDSTSLLTPSGPTGQDIVVALIDSGIDTDNPGVAGAKIVRAPRSGTGDYTDTGHGTVAAAILVSPIGDATRALAPGIRILDVPADLCDQDQCGCDPCASMTPAEAIRWSTDNGANIISMSFGYLPSAKPAWWQLLLDDDELESTTETIEVALAYASESGVAMTAAAGNCAQGGTQRCETDDQFEVPAGHSSVIGVAATAADEDGTPTRAWYSTRQSYVELAAPGNLIFTGPDGETIEKNGTSYATPFVTAALAVLTGSDGPLAGRPNSLAEARQVLSATARDLAPSGRDVEFGHGQLQLDAAIAEATQFVIDNPLPPQGAESNADVSDEDVRNADEGDADVSDEDVRNADEGDADVSDEDVRNADEGDADVSDEDVSDME